jgi:predicted amino acid dehydrogenase
VPANVARNLVEERNDILIFEGGYAAMPNFNELPISFRSHFRFGSIFGCLAETIILALEGRFENYSIGRGNITSEKVDEIARLGSRHGFTLAPYFCGNKIFVEEDFCRIRSVVNMAVVPHKI